MFVRAGSILPLAPVVQYAEQSKWEKLEIVVYPGADATFTLYEDEGDNYNYEKGIYSTITFKWNDKAGVLTIDKRQGSFPGMLTTRKFNVKIAGSTAKSITYNGKRTTVRLK